MMRSIRLLPVLGLLALAAGCGGTGSSGNTGPGGDPAPPALQPQELLKKAMAAHGGEARLRALKALAVKAKAKHADGEGETSVHLEFPDRIRTEDTRNGMTMLFVSNGKEAWRKRPDGETLDVSIQEATFQIIGMRIQRTLTPLLDPEITLTAQPTARVGDAHVYVLRAIHRDAPKTTLDLLFDAKSFRLVKTELRAQPAQDRQFFREMWWDDYQNADGLPFARKVTIKVDGKDAGTLTIVEVKFPDKLDAKLFEKPK